MAGNWTVLATGGAGLGQINGPWALAADGAGNLYAADLGNGELRADGPGAETGRGGELDGVGDGGGRSRPGSPPPGTGGRRRGQSLCGGSGPPPAPLRTGKAAYRSETLKGTGRSWPSSAISTGRSQRPERAGGGRCGQPVCDGLYYQRQSVSFPGAEAGRPGELEGLAEQRYRNWTPPDMVLAWRSTAKETFTCRSSHRNLGCKSEDPEGTGPR